MFTLSSLQKFVNPLNSFVLHYHPYLNLQINNNNNNNNNKHTNSNIAISHNLKKLPLNNLNLNFLLFSDLLIKVANLFFNIVNTTNKNLSDNLMTPTFTSLFLLQFTFGPLLLSDT